MDTTTWMGHFQLPHESNWSLHHKKCFVDGYTVKPLSGYGSSMNHAQETYLGSKLTTLRGRYCPECTKHGYHAWFHQLICFDHCVLHPEHKLLDVDYPATGSHKESFFQKAGTRAIDLMDNTDFRHEIEAKIQLNYDRIAVIDIMEYRYGAQSCFRSPWYTSTLQTLQERCISNGFTAARKVTTIPIDADKRIKEWVDQYLNYSVIPWLCRKIKEPYTDDQFRHLKDYWKQIKVQDPREVLNLIMHKEFFNLCEQIGGVENYEIILKSIHAEVFDTELCDYHTYGKIIALILSSHYCSVGHLEQLYRGLRYVTGVPRFSSKLEFGQIDMDQVVNVRKGNYRNMEVPILSAILKDVLSHTASVLGDLMAGKRCLTGGGVTGDIYNSFFCLPVSQYIAIWNAGTVELWACDPNVDALLSNISRAKEIFNKTDKLKEPPEMAQV